MSVTKNKEVVLRHLEEVWKKGNLKATADTISPEFTIQAGPITLKGPEDFSKLVAENLKAYPDVKITVNDMVAEGDKVAMHCTWEGNFTGEFFGLKPTGKHFKTQSAFFYRIKDGKIAEAWQLEDNTFKQQVGLPIA